MAEQQYVGSWKIIRKLGDGGQGTVYLVRSPERQRAMEESLKQVAGLLGSATAYTQEQRFVKAEALIQHVAQYSRPDRPEELGAGKIYDIRGGGAIAEQTVARLQREFEVLAAALSPHILRVFETDIGSKLMIAEYHPHGTLADVPARFQGRPLEALQALRGVVEAVAMLHKRGVVHRDIKPVNIFVANDGRLVLGDFGIVYVESGQAARLTETFEKVGTSAFMPPWAMTGARIDEVKPSFDVFTLAKVLWCMLSGRSALHLWYWDREPNDLTKLFPKAPAMSIVNETILEACLVAEEEDCLSDAGVLLQRIDEALDVLGTHGRQIGENRMWCVVCGRTTYVTAFSKQGDRLLLIPASQGPSHPYNPSTLFERRQYLTVQAYKCPICGHVALFHFPEGKPPEAWNL